MKKDKLKVGDLVIYRYSPNTPIEIARVTGISERSIRVVTFCYPTLTAGGCVKLLPVSGKTHSSIVQRGRGGAIYAYDERKLVEVLKAWQKLQEADKELQNAIKQLDKLEW